jgi:hypothetical protein
MIHWRKPRNWRKSSLASKKMTMRSHCVWAVLCLAVCCAFAGSASAATPTYVQGTFCSDTNGAGAQSVTTYQCFFPNPTTAGNAIFCAGKEDHKASDPTFSLADGGDSFTVDVTQDNNAAGGSTNQFIAHAVNIASGRTQVTLTLSASDSGVQMHCGEFSNIATSSPVDGATCSNANTSTAVTCGTAIGANTDLLITETIVDSGNFAASPITMTAGTGMTLVSSDVQAGHSLQYRVLAGSVNAAETLSASQSWGMVGVAYKSASSGGTLSGIHVVGVEHNEILNVTPDKAQMEFTGTLGVVSWIGTDPFRITAISDSTGNTWTQASAGTGWGSSGGANFCKGSTGSSGDGQFWYLPNPTAGKHVLTLTLSGTSGNSSMFIYDVAGTLTTASVFDKDQCDTGTDSTTGGSVAGGSFSGLAASGELVIGNMPVATCEVTGETATSGGTDVEDFTITSPIFGTGSLDENNGWEHINSTTGTTVQFSYTKSNTPGCTNTQLGEWAEAKIAFKPTATAAAPGFNKQRRYERLDTSLR